MTWFATLERVTDQPWSRRLVVRGRLDVYVRPPDHRAWTGPKEAVRYAMVVRLGNELLRTWNSMSLVCGSGDEATHLGFEIMVRPGSSRQAEAIIARLDSAQPEREWESLRELHAQAERDQTNVLVVFPGARNEGLGFVPPVSPRTRGRGAGAAQPWSSVMCVSTTASSYTLSHEVGHLLGLAEGYGPVTTQRLPSGLAARTEQMTLSGHGGTPMALPRDAGRDASASQLEAIVAYAEAALGAGGAVGRYGRVVDHYRARWASR